MITVNAALQVREWEIEISYPAIVCRVEFFVIKKTASREARRLDFC